MLNNPDDTHLKPYPASACADCLETAGGRQREHNCAWLVEVCPVCNHKTTVTDPKNFGTPTLIGFYRQITKKEAAE